MPTEHEKLEAMAAQWRARLELQQSLGISRWRVDADADNAMTALLKMELEAWNARTNI